MPQPSLNSDRFILMLILRQAVVNHKTSKRMPEQLNCLGQEGREVDVSVASVSACESRGWEAGMQEWPPVAQCLHETQPK